MDPVTIGIGIAALIFSSYTAVARQTAPHRFSKLEPMKAKFGDRTGLMIHIVAYTAIPAVFGLVMIFAAMTGVPIFG